MGAKFETWERGRKKKIRANAAQDEFELLAGSFNPFKLNRSIWEGIDQRRRA
jgi:hypothetical protein